MMHKNKATLPRIFLPFLLWGLFMTMYSNNAGATAPSRWDRTSDISHGPKYVSLGNLRLPFMQWASIHLLGKKVGYSTTDVDITINQSLVDFHTRSFLPYLRFDQEQTATLEPDLRIRRVHVILNAETTIEYIGEVKEGILEGRISAMGKPESRNVPVPKGVYLPETLPWVHLLSGAKPGEERQWPTFRVDTTGVEMASAVITSVSPADKPAEAVITIRFAGQPVNSTYTMEGRFLGESGQISGLDYVSYPEDQSSAEAMPEEASGQLTQKEIVEKVSIRTEKPIPTPWNVKELMVKIGPIPKEGPHVDDQIQTLLESDGEPSGATLTIRIAAPGEPESVIAAVDWSKYPAVAEWLKPSLLIQSDDPEIQERASRLVKDVTDPWAIAGTLREFCYKYVDSSGLRFTLPSAIEVLHSGKGDCNEHAALYAGLARAAGLPCKSVGGLVYVNYGNGRHGFYYHAWNEVALLTSEGPKWYPIDSTLDTNRTDATHIRLVEGDLDQQSTINNLIGNIKVEIVSWKEGL